MGRQRLFVLERGMKHGTKFNHTCSRVSSRSTYLLATDTPSSSCAIPGPCWKPVLPRVLGVGRIRGTQGGPFRPHLVVGHSGMAHGFPENGGCPDPFSIVSGHLQKTHARTFSGFTKARGFFGLEWFQLNSREQRRCQRSVKSRTAVSRTTKGALISARCFAPWSG